MTYQALYTKSAFNDIQQLDVVTKKRLKKKIEKYLENPLLHAKRLINTSLGEYRWRIGNYRVIFDLKKNVVVVLKIGHRKEIYK